MIALNSKNSYGAYTGVTVFNVTFENGEAAEVRQMEGLSVLGPARNAALMERTQAIAQTCPRIPDGEVQRLLAN